MHEITANRDAWALLAREHYEKFKNDYETGNFRFNRYIEDELGDIAGKRLLHLQCNTGADTLYLARKGAIVTGVDLVPENIQYAKQLADDLGVGNATFIACDIMELSGVLKETYDIVFTSEGAIIWLPDLPLWGRIIREYLKDDGTFYAFDMHPTYLMMHEDAFAEGKLEIRYPYFMRYAEEDNSIGGYAAPPRPARVYSWMYTLADVINALIDAGLSLAYLHEFDVAICDLGGFTDDRANGVFTAPLWQKKFPLSFSVKATVR